MNDKLDRHFRQKIGARGLVGWQDVAPWRWKRTTPGISWFLRQLSLSAHQPCSFARVEQYQSIGRCANDYLALSQLGTLRVHFFTLNNQKQKVGFAKVFSSLGSESFPHFFSRWLLRFWQIISAKPCYTNTYDFPVSCKISILLQSIWRHKSGLYQLYWAKDTFYVN